MDTILKRLQEKRIAKIHESKEITISMNDSEGNIMGLLKTISDYSKIGHSFTVVVDPGDERYEKKFWIDGDGSDKLYLD